MTSLNTSEAAIHSGAIGQAATATEVPSAGAAQDGTTSTLGRWVCILIASLAGGGLGLVVGLMVALFAGLIDFSC